MKLERMEAQDKERQQGEEGSKKPHPYPISGMIVVWVTYKGFLTTIE